jgi:hypothetical protein
MPEYKCVPAPKELIKAAKSDYSSEVRGFADLINREAQDGWKFYSMETIAVTERAGCFAALIGAKDTTVYFNMLIFEK